MSGRYSERLGDGPRRIWSVARLWVLARDLPVVEVPIADIAGFDQVTWFSLDGPLPTCRSVAEHARRIMAADLTYPVIFSASGGVMDGMHRIARAWLDGRPTVRGVRFAVDPEPDEVTDR